jgi:hypothetical protein
VFQKVVDAALREWTQQASAARTKTQARRLADELEPKAERERLRLEPIPTDSGLSLAELCEWWLENRCPPASRYRERKRLEGQPREEHLAGAIAPACGHDRSDREAPARDGM